MAHRIYVNEIKPGKRGMLYDAEYEGEIICQSTTTPFLDGCRVLAQRGLSGAVEMWDHNRSFPRMLGDINKTAGLAIRDSDAGTKFIKYAPYDKEASVDGDSQ